MRDPFLIEAPAIISFSGGRTSAYMLRRILDAHGGRLPEGVHAVFANTGKEREETLDFVKECSDRWNVRVAWVEFYRPVEEPENFILVEDVEQVETVRIETEDFVAIGIRPKQKRSKTFKHWRLTSYEDASRSGEPFREVIVRKQFLPNPVTRYCTTWLKLKPIWAFARSLGFDHWNSVIGIRADEPRRAAKIKLACETFEEPSIPLYDAGITKQDVMRFWCSQPFDLQLEQWEGNCDLCLAADTEVVTSEGIRRIGDLAGQSPELLIPKIVTGPYAGDGLLSEVGHFETAPVRSFGIQQLWRIELAGHGRATKIIHATADHRWFLTRRKKGQRIPEGAVATKELQKGDRLRNLFRCPIGENRGQVSRIGAMRGFVFGDGTVHYGSRPGVLQVHAGKDEVFLPMFAACLGEPVEQMSVTGRRIWKFYGVPHYWKGEYPSLKESRHYLIGWLSGWFAADGCVSSDGVCVLSSAFPERLEFARSICAVLGIQCGQVRQQERVVSLPQGRGDRTHTIYTVNLLRNHLPDDFFWLEHHRERVLANRSKEERRFGWMVVSVEPTERVEEVFCASISGVGAFGLADGLMTGNCFLKGQHKRLRIIRDRPDLAEWWMDREREMSQPFRAHGPSYAQLVQIATAPTLFEDEELDELTDCFCGTD